MNASQILDIIKDYVQSSNLSVSEVISDLNFFITKCELLIEELDDANTSEVI